MKFAAITVLFCSASFAQTDPSVELTRLRKVLQDWPDLTRYAADNAKLTAETRVAGDAKLSSETKVVFMGDSITDAWIKRSPKYFADNPTYVDRGISGQTTPQMLIRFRP